MEEKKKLVEYWPERREWVNSETGEVLARATSAEAEVLARMASHGEVAGVGGDVKRVTNATLLALDGEGPDGVVAQVLDGDHGETAAVPAPTDVADVAGAYWLWVDPRREANYREANFDQVAFLERAIARFQSKPRWGGRHPEVVKVHPGLAGNGLGPGASALGLAVVGDPTVAAGTYQLGLWVKGGAEGER